MKSTEVSSKIIYLNTRTMKQEEFIKNLKVGPLKILSLLNLTLGILSVVLHSCILANFRKANYIDPIGWGIWIGSVFCIAGSFGLAGARNKIRCLIITTIPFSALAVILSILGSVFTSIAALLDYCATDNCEVYEALEFILLILNVIAFFTNIVLIVIASLAVCSCCPCYKWLPYDEAAVSELPNGHIAVEETGGPYIRLTD